MKVKQAVKHFTLLGIMVAGVSACSSVEEPEESAVQVTSQPAVTVEPVVEEPIVQEDVIEDSEEEVTDTAINNGVIDIPVLDDAQIFAELTDSRPAVVNYFTNASEAQVIDFYQQAFGEATSQERKYGRLTLYFLKGEEMMRVAISQQDRKRQVDVIVESKN